MDIKKKIEKHNIKATIARVSLLEIFSQAQKPLSYEDIKPELKMDKATFYRNISLFIDAGLLNSFESNDKKRYFELKSHPHAHFICRVCNSVECIDNLNITLQEYQIENIIINGLCKQCTVRK
ncbi:MAG TPA: transcriptional repressor [Nitratifractor sp.]|nr:transcriptional repressor [Nitratifractor sp.]